MLTSHTPVLSRAGVKKLLPILFEHNSKGFELLLELIGALTRDIFAGAKNGDWPSLTPDSFGIFFQHCFSFLNKKLGEFQKNLKSDAPGILDEASIAAMMERLAQIADLTKALVVNISAPSVPAKVHRLVLTQGPAWIDNSKALFGFLRDAREVDEEAVDSFIDSIRAVRNNMQVVVDHVRRNTPELQMLLPSMSKALSSWSYAAKQAFSTIGFENARVRVGVMPIRTIEGDIIPSQRELPSD
jgi:hypothetical protein